VRCWNDTPCHGPGMIKSSQAAVDLIVAEEVSSQAVYQARYQHPEWPGGASGVTIGIGYDCGYSPANTIQGDWGDKLPAPMVKCLQDVAGIHGFSCQLLRPMPCAVS
jgi:hypothetical protein